ncbi:hypothetical protein AB7Z03_25960 [Escherichia coli]
MPVTPHFMYVKKVVVPAAVSRPERSDRVSEEASFHYSGMVLRTLLSHLSQNAMATIRLAGRGHI